MIDSKVAKRYAQALFSVAKDRNVLDLVAADLKDLALCLTASEELALFIRTPIFTKEERTLVIKNVFEGKVQLLVITFLMFLVEKNRLNIIGDVIEMFAKLYRDEKRILDVRLETEREMEPAILEVILKKLSQRLNRKVEATVRIAPELLGGFKLSVQDVVYDASLKTQLQKFQESVTSTV